MSQDSSDAAADADAKVDRSWDGHSLREWAIDPRSLVNPNTLASGYGSAAGYVAGGILVVPEATLLVPSIIPLVVKSGILTGQLLRRDDGSWEIVRGRFGGSVAVKEFLPALASLRFTTGGSAPRTLCTAVEFPLALRAVCEVVDLPDEDGSCNALSIGASFTATGALLGPIRSADLDLVETCTMPARCQ